MNLRDSLFVNLLIMMCCLLSNVYAYCQLNKEEQSNELSFDSKELIKFQYKILNDSLFLVRKDNKFGIIDSSGQINVPIIYDRINVSSDIRETFIWKKRDENYFFYNYWEDGNESKEEYEILLQKELSNSESCLNLTNNFLENPVFVVQKGGKWGVINKRNEIKIPFVYDYLYEIGYDIFVVKNDEGYGIIDLNSNNLVSPSCDTIVKVHLYARGMNGIYAYVLLKKGDEYGVMNLYTKQVIQPKYSDIESCYFRMEDFCLCGFSDNIEKYYDERMPDRRSNDLHEFNDLLIFKSEGKYGLLNVKNMNELTDRLYDTISFKKSIAGRKIVLLNNKETFLIENNSMLYLEVFDRVNLINHYLDEDVFKVEINSLQGVYDNTGKKLLDIEWDHVITYRQLKADLKYQFTVKRKNKVGVVNSDGEIIIPIKYDQVTYGENYFVVTKKGVSKKKLMR